MPAAPLSHADPTSVGGYTLLGRLGAGGMGVVYLARNAAGEEVAVKVLHERLAASPQFLARFADEAAAAARVAGFCTARVLHADVRARPPYLVTEYVPGPTLDEVLASGQPLQASEVEALAVGVAAALTAIHAAGLAHRDLKPSNVLLSRLGPKVIDFGIARALDVASDRTESGILLGTLGWLAPEQLYGRSTQATDVFVWGLLITRAGTRWHPAPELRVSVPSAAEIATLPRSLAAAVTAALNLDPAARPAARDLLLRLCGSAEAGPVRSATKALSHPWSAPYPTSTPYPASTQYQPGAGTPRPNGSPQPAGPSRPDSPSLLKRLSRRKGSGRVSDSSRSSGSPGSRHPAGSPQPSGVRHPARPARRLPPPHARNGPAAAPYPPAGMPRPGYPPVHPAAKRRRRHWYTRKRFLLMVALIVLVAVLNRGDGKTEQPLPSGTARDGILEFTVVDWECGRKTLGAAPYVREAQGQLCTFDLRVRNFGDQARMVHVGSQKLRDAAGRTFSADESAWMYLVDARPFFQHGINPGNELDGTLVYDVAADSQPTGLVVHDSPFSGGAVIQLA